MWHDKFSHAFLGDGFSYSEANNCVYTRSKNGDCVIICLYVDDMLIFGTCIDIVLKTKAFLASKFDMKDMVEASFILRVRIIRKSYSMTLTQ